MQFNVGDRVRVVSDIHFPEQVGKTGVIEEDDRSSLPYRVRFDGGGRPEDWYRASEIASQVFKLQVPEEPVGVDRVRPVGHEWMRYERMDTGDWVREDSSSLVYDWQELLKMHPEGVEPVPSDFEVSLDYLRRNAHVLDGLEASGVTGSHAAAVVRNVIAESERGVLAKEGSE